MSRTTNRIYTPIVFALTLVVGIFFVKPLYTEYMDSRTQMASVQLSQKEKQRNLDALIELQQTFANSGSTDLSDRVKKINKTWDEAGIMTAIMLNDYTKGSEFAPAPVLVNTISLDTGKKLPSGLSLGTIQLSLTTRSIDDIISYLTYLTTSTSYVFTLDTISLPISVPVQKELN